VEIIVKVKMMEANIITINGVKESKRSD